MSCASCSALGRGTEFTIIGEAAARLSRLDPERFARITKGRRIVDFRNQLTHECQRVDDRIVWLIARDDVPVLLAECAALQAEVGDADGHSDKRPDTGSRSLTPLPMTSP